MPRAWPEGVHASLYSDGGQRTSAYPIVTQYHIPQNVKTVCPSGGKPENPALCTSNVEVPNLLQATRNRISYP